MHVCHQHIATDWASEVGNKKHFPSGHHCYAVQAEFDGVLAHAQSAAASTTASACASDRAAAAAEEQRVNAVEALKVACRPLFRALTAHARHAFLNHITQTI